MSLKPSELPVGTVIGIGIPRPLKPAVKYSETHLQDDPGHWRYIHTGEQVPIDDWKGGWDELPGLPLPSLDPNTRNSDTLPKDVKSFIADCTCLPVTAWVKTQAQYLLDKYLPSNPLKLVSTRQLLDELIIRNND